MVEINLTCAAQCLVPTSPETLQMHYCFLADIFRTSSLQFDPSGDVSQTSPVLAVITRVHVFFSDLAVIRVIRSISDCSPSSLLRTATILLGHPSLGISVRRFFSVVLRFLFKGGGQAQVPIIRRGRVFPTLIWIAQVRIYTAVHVLTLYIYTFIGAKLQPGVFSLLL